MFLPLRNINPLIILALFACTIANYSFSQFISRPKFHNFTVENGLPSSETYFVHQDKTGYIWICTDHGVARYDGNKFKKYTTADGLTDNVVFKIYEDYKGRIWFITYNSELCYLEKEKIHKYRYNNLIINKIKGRIVPQKSIHIDTNDNVYISLKGKGFLKITKNGKCTSIDCKDRIQIFKLDNKFFWAFEQTNYDIENMDSVSFIHLKNGISKRIGKLDSRGRISLTTNYRGSFFLADDDLYDLNLDKTIFNEKSAISVQSFNTQLWIGTFKNGVLHFLDINDTSKHHRFLQGYSVSSILVDREGGYWFTTLEKGVFYTPYISVTNYTVNEGLIDNNITSIGGVGKNIYMGFLLGRWQNLYDKGDYDDVKNSNSRTVVGNSRHKVYISTLLPEYKPKSSPSTYSFWSSDYFTEENAVILGSRWIFRKYDNGKLEILYNNFLDKSPHKKNIIECLMMDKTGCLWIGSLSGLNYIKNNQTLNKGLADPLFKVRVSDLETSDEWQNIAATQGEGIYFFEDKKIFRRLTTKNGLLSNFVNVLYLDENNGIWAGSNKGLNHITKDVNGKLKIACFTILHGLCSNEINSIYRYDDLVYVATKEGLSVIDLKNFRRNLSIAKIIITSISTSTHNYSPSQHHVFSYKEGYIKISFRNTNYRSLQHGLYKYRISKSSEWICTETPEVLLINPLPGEYNLEISYRNEDGNWSDSKVYASFIIDEVFYKKSFFYIGISIVLGIIFWLLYRYRVGQLKQRHKLNNKIRNLEQKALQAQMNPHFIFNALNSIQSFLVYEENDKAEKYLLKFAQLIRQTLSNSREAYISVETEIETLTKYLDLERMRFKDKFSYEIENFIEAHDLSLKIPGMLVQPFVENAVIHGFSTLESGGKIKITLKLVDQYQLLCVVEDNGVGRKKTFLRSSANHVSFGTTITEERLKAFETKHGIHFHFEIIDIENEDGTTGTKVLINLPIIY